MNDTWNKDISSLYGASILQTSHWGNIKQAYGWQPHYKTWVDQHNILQAAALILERSINFLKIFQMRVLYIPRGPLLRDWQNSYWRNKVLDDIQSFAKERGAIFIKIDPEVILGNGIPGNDDAVENELGHTLEKELIQRKWLYSSEQIQFKNTVCLDLNHDEEEWLKRMKQKTRYNVRLASRKGISVRIGTSEDLQMLYKMYAETSLRDGFIIRSEDYYINLWKLFMENNMAEPIIAEVDGEAIAGIFLFHFANKSWYLHGMSSNAHREKMPNYFLQWEAMKRSRELGCHIYDLWGAPTIFDDSDPMWGVFRFKEGLGGYVVRTIGAWDFPNKSFLYILYTSILPKLLGVLRKFGREKTKESISI